MPAYLSDDDVLILRQVVRAYKKAQAKGQARISFSLPEEPTQIEVVELQEALTAGGNAEVRRQIWNGSAWADADSTDELYEFEAYDYLNEMEGDSGDKAIVWFHQQSGRWLFMQKVCPA